MTDSPPFSTLYPILDDGLETKDSLPHAVEALAAAGCRLVQIRSKRLTLGEFLEWCEIAVRAARPSGMAVIVNDRPDVANMAGAHGVHLGQDDVSVDVARRVLGAGAIVGLSTHDLEQAKAATGLNVDYVAIGPVFDTSSKLAAGPPLGVGGVRRVRAVVDKPLVAIGGVSLAHANELIAAGADGLAVISALHDSGRDAASVERVARQWLEQTQSPTRRESDARAPANKESS